MKYPTILLALSVAFFVFSMPAQAQEKVGTLMADARVTQQIPADKRVKVLKTFLQKYNSPLADNAATFVATADKYDLDWRLVASIAGLESTFGHQIPTNSYNAWGWGVYGDNVIRFASWDQGIETVSKGLRARYLKSGDHGDVYTIGPTYSASATWAVRVEYFMDKIDQVASNDPTYNLSLSL